MRNHLAAKGVGADRQLTADLLRSQCEAGTIRLDPEPKAFLPTGRAAPETVSCEES